MITTLQAFEQIQAILVRHSSFDRGPFTVAQLLLQRDSDVLNRSFVLILDTVAVDVLPYIVTDGAEQVCACVMGQISSIHGQLNDIREATVQSGIIKELGFGIVQVITHTVLDTDVLIRIVEMHLIAASIQFIEEVTAILAYGLATDTLRIQRTIFVDLVQGNHSAHQRNTVGSGLFIHFCRNALGIVVVLIIEHEATQCAVDSDTSIPSHIVFGQMNDLGIHDLAVLIAYEGCVGVCAVRTCIIYSKRILRCVTGMLVNSCQVKLNYIIALRQILEQIVTVVSVLRSCCSDTVRCRLTLDGVVCRIQLIEVNGCAVYTRFTFILNTILIVVYPYIVTEVNELYVTGINGGIDLTFQLTIRINSQCQSDRISYA